MLGPSKAHVPIVCTPQGAYEHVSQKGYYLIIMQALVDYKGRFMNTNVECTCRVHDARMLTRSGIYLFGQDGTLFPASYMSVHEVFVPTVILGDAA